jgi:hypothetical protein
MSNLYYFIIWLGTGIIIAAFIISIFLLKKDKPFYFKFIFAFILLGLSLSMSTIAFHSFRIWESNFKEIILIQQVLLLLQCLMLGLFFIEVLKKSKFKKAVRVLFFLSIFVQITLFSSIIMANIEIRPFISSHLFLLLFCFFYFRDLMNTKPTIILVKSSTFWIVMGIFYSSCIGFPVNSLISLIPRDQEYINLRSQVSSLSNFALIILYIFIIKSYLCLKHPQNL